MSIMWTFDWHENDEWVSSAQRLPDCAQAAAAAAAWMVINAVNNRIVQVRLAKVYA